jgi:hypothetical protein
MDVQQDDDCDDPKKKRDKDGAIPRQRREAGSSPFGVRIIRVRKVWPYPQDQVSCPCHDPVVLKSRGSPSRKGKGGLSMSRMGAPSGAKAPCQPQHPLRLCAMCDWGGIFDVSRHWFGCGIPKRSGIRLVPCGMGKVTQKPNASCGLGNRVFFLVLLTKGARRQGPWSSLRGSRLKRRREGRRRKGGGGADGEVEKGRKDAKSERGKERKQRSSSNQSNLTGKPVVVAPGMRRWEMRGSQGVVGTGPW